MHGDGDDIDAFADVVIVNYEVLDRHVAWLSRRGFKGMVVDEAHFIKNKDSQRSKNVQALSKSIRAVDAEGADDRAHRNPADQPDRGLPHDLAVPRLDRREEAAGRAHEASSRTPSSTRATPGFFRAARDAVVDMGIVRRKKVDVAADIPARRVADIPVELDGEAGRSIREAEAALVARLVERYRRVLATRPDSDPADLIRLVAAAELEETRQAGGDGTRRQRVHHGAQDRPGQGDAGRRLHGQPGPQRRQGGVLRQAHRRDGRRPRSTSPRPA